MTLGRNGCWPSCAEHNSTLARQTPIYGACCGVTCHGRIHQAIDRGRARHLSRRRRRQRQPHSAFSPSTLEFFELGLGGHFTADLLGDGQLDPLALLARESALIELSSYVVPEPRPVAAISLQAAEI